MNSETTTIGQLFADLPPEAQQQVLDYVTLLKQRYMSPRPRKTLKRTALANESFIGIWRNRKDLQDSTGWVRAVRESEWVRHRE